MSEALAETEWLRGFYEEMVNPRFDIVNWSARTRHRGLLCAARTIDPDRKLAQVLTICDAKSLYDALSQEQYTGVEKRAALEICVIRHKLESMGEKAR